MNLSKTTYNRLAINFNSKLKHSPIKNANYKSSLYSCIGYVVVALLCIACSSPLESEKQYKKANESLLISKTTMQQNLKKLAKNNLEISVISDKVNKLKLTNNKASFFLSQIESATITANKTQELLLTQINNKLEENKTIKKSDYKKQIESINPLLKKYKEEQLSFNKTLQAMNDTKSVIETIIANNLTN